MLAIYGPETTGQLVAVGTDVDDDRPVKVHGYVSEPALNWSNRNHINLFVNGRWIRDNRLTYAVIQAYHTLLPVGRYPFGLVFIDMPPEEVDVNVHPTKVEVRFRDEGLLFGAVQRTVRAGLLETGPVRDLGAWPDTRSFDGPVAWAGTTSTPSHQNEATPLQPGLDWSGQTSRDDARDISAVAGQADGVEGRAAKLPLMRVIGQVGAAYIIAEGPEGLYLIDQHAAHERILYEQLLADWQQRQVMSQGLVAGAALYLSPAQSTLLEEHAALLADLGFKIEAFGPNAVVLRAVPAFVGPYGPGAGVTGCAV